MIMEKDNDKKEISENMKSGKTGNTIDFTDYAPLNKDYDKEELAEIYKKIITDIKK